MDDKLPLELLKEKYIPVEACYEKYGISIVKVMKLINSRKLRYAEFKAPGAIRRTPHINPEDLFKILEEEGEHYELDPKC